MKLKDEDLEQDDTEETLKNTLYNKAVGKVGDEDEDDEESGSDY